MSARGRCGRRPILLRQDGVAAVEMALLAVLIFWFMASALFIARSVMQATLVQRAVDHAAHLISNYPEYLRSDPSVNLDSEVTNLVTDELISGGMPTSAIGSVGIYCISCTGKTPPVSVGAYVSVNILDPSNVLPNVNTLTITASATDRYAN